MPRRIYCRNGQALSELAIFGSMFLFVLAIFIQYGLTVNFRDAEEMATFRKAIEIAYAHSGDYRSASVQSLHDRAFPDPRDNFGINERNSFSANSSVLFTPLLAGKYIKGEDNTLPRITYIVGNQEITRTNANWGGSDTWELGATSSIRIKKKDSSIPGCVPDVFNDCQIAKYNDPIVMNGWCERKTVFGRWDPTGCGNLQGDYPKADLKNKLELEDTLADVNGDGNDELIIAQHTATCCDKATDVFTKRRIKWVSSVDYMDYESGQINAKDEKQGLRPDYTRQLNVNDGTYIGKLENTEEAPDSIITTTGLDMQDEVTHKLVDNSGTHDIVEEFPRQTTTTWETTNN